jgi:hypothetical protein
MSDKIHFYLRTDRPTKDGSAQIILLFTIWQKTTIDRKHRLKISTGKFIPLKKEYRKLLPAQIAELVQKKRRIVLLEEQLKVQVTGK